MQIYPDSSELILWSPPAKQHVTTWHRMWDGLPQEGAIVPIWDGDYLYYATFWQKDGQQFWIVANQIVQDVAHPDLRKQPGEQVYPIHWMQIEAPTQ